MSTVKKVLLRSEHPPVALPRSQPLFGARIADVDSSVVVFDALQEIIKALFALLKALLPGIDFDNILHFILSLFGGIDFTPILRLTSLVKNAVNDVLSTLIGKVNWIKREDIPPLCSKGLPAS